MPRLLVLLVLVVPSSVFADETHSASDAPAPSLSLPSDPARPVYRYAAYIDPVALFEDGYGLSVMAAFSRFASITVSPFGAKSSGGTLGLELGLHARPFGRGVHGLSIGGGIGALLMRENDARELRLFADAGYVHVLGGVLLGGSAGVSVRWNDGERSVAPRVRVVLGFAFR